LKLSGRQPGHGLVDTAQLFVGQRQRDAARGKGAHSRLSFAAYPKSSAIP
jgi:hypothetical protein